MQAFSACFMKFCLALNSYKSKKKQMGRRPEGTCSFLVSHEEMTGSWWSSSLVTGRQADCYKGKQIQEKKGTMYEKRRYFRRHH